MNLDCLRRGKPLKGLFYYFFVVLTPLIALSATLEQENQSADQWCALECFAVLQ